MVLICYAILCVALVRVLSEAQSPSANHVGHPKKNVYVLTAVVLEKPACNSLLIYARLVCAGV